MANRSKSRTQTPAQELRKIERLLGEEFDTLAEARRALKKESKPVAEKKSNTDFNYGKNSKNKELSKPAPKPAAKRFNIKTATANQKKAYAKKIGKAEYNRRLHDYWDEYPDLEPDDNPYTYHE